MRILVADDDESARDLLAALIRGLGHEVVTASGGEEAWSRLVADPVPLVVTDRLMPDLDGLDLCRRIRAAGWTRYTYVVLATIPGEKERYLEGMDAGADDYLGKPFDPDELEARLRVAERVLGLQETVRTLEQMLRVCAYCRRIREGGEGWVPLESYMARRAAPVSHGVCPDCYRTRVEPELSWLRLRHPGPPGGEPGSS